jgi:gas vesicle protein
MDTYRQEPRDHRFLIGLIAGSFVGAALAMWLAPRSAPELRGRLTDPAKGLGTRVGEKVDELTRNGQDVKDDVADAVARGAHEVARGAHVVEHYATAAKSARAK